MGTLKAGKKSYTEPDSNQRPICQSALKLNRRHDGINDFTEL